MFRSHERDTVPRRCSDKKKKRKKKSETRHFASLRARADGRGLARDTFPQRRDGAESRSEKSPARAISRRTRAPRAESPCLRAKLPIADASPANPRRGVLAPSTVQRLLYRQLHLEIAGRCFVGRQTVTVAVVTRDRPQSEGRPLARARKDLSLVDATNAVPSRLISCFSFHRLFTTLYLGHTAFPNVHPCGCCRTLSGKGIN